LKLWHLRAAIPGALGILLSISAAAQETVASDPPVFVAVTPFELTMMRVVTDSERIYPLQGIDVPYSCYRIGRCSAYDLYYFRDRPNRLTRLAPEPPAESAELAPSIQYQWIFVPVTPQENIVPKYRTASQVRDEYRAVGRLID